MRLIDAELFKKQVAAMTIRNGYIPEKANALCELIDSQPTAFDAVSYTHPTLPTKLEV